LDKSESLEKVEGVVIGVIISCASSGVPMVAYSGNLSGAPVEAKSTIALNSESIGREVALLFEGGDVQRPIIIGLMHNPQVVEPERAETDIEEAYGVWNPDTSQTNVVVDGESMRVTANREIVLKCGKASITLTSSGKVIIRGNYISSRSSGVNRIKGGSVQIN